MTERVVEDRRIFEIEVGNMSDAEVKNFVALIKEQYEDFVRIKCWDRESGKWIKK